MHAKIWHSAAISLTVVPDPPNSTAAPSLSLESKISLLMVLTSYLSKMFPNTAGKSHPSNTTFYWLMHWGGCSASRNLGIWILPPTNWTSVGLTGRALVKLEYKQEGVALIIVLVTLRISYILNSCVKRTMKMDYQSESWVQTRFFITAVWNRSGEVEYW